MIYIKSVFTSQFIVFSVFWFFYVYVSLRDHFQID